ncbi:hypothetical protein DFS33DRAFT_1276050 [Desarmillaria ectypa]|nr:hypothetical protein DFS33DRAFT_1276050 [Desarmillaria ectypa]
MHNLKRAGSNPAGPAPTTKKSRPLYETLTPFPNPSSDSLAYKLPSSVPRPGDTGRFSPVPVPSVRRTSSRNLKENRVGGKANSKSRSRSKSKSKGVLESPFPVFVPDLYAPSRFPKRTLSDKFPPNISIPQQSHSTTTSPQSVQLQSERRRRPSAPTPPRTNFSFLDPDIKHHAGIVGDVQFSIASPEVDFNRPPSQLSFYDGAPGMFADVQFVSTPFRFVRNGQGSIDPLLLSKRDNPMSDTETDTDEEGVITSPFKLLKRSLQRKRQMSAGYTTPDEEEETGWISDSLISPPTRGGDVEMADPDLAEQLSLDSLILNCEVRPEPLRTRSLDSSASASSLAPVLPIKTATRRTRSGTVLQSQGTTNEVTVGRTRSGTVTQRTRSGTVTKRARSGSILAPPSPVVSGGKIRSGSILNNRAPPPVGRKPGRLEALIFSTPEDELPFPRPSVRRARVRDGQMKMYRHPCVEGEEDGVDEEDELLLVLGHLHATELALLELLLLWLGLLLFGLIALHWNANGTGTGTLFVLTTLSLDSDCNCPGLYAFACSRRNLHVIGTNRPHGEKMIDSWRIGLKLAFGTESSSSSHSGKEKKILESSSTGIVSRRYRDKDQIQVVV